MENEKRKISRTGFLKWGISLASVLAIPSFFRFSRKKRGSQKVKMLTREGKLVEIDVADIPSKKEKIRDADIHTWISNKSSL